jgi:hypothetical protein
MFHIKAPLAKDSGQLVIPLGTQAYATSCYPVPFYAASSPDGHSHVPLSDFPWSFETSA